MKYKNKIIVFLVFVLMAFSAFSATDKATNKKKEKLEVPNIVLKDQYGKQHNLQDYKGKVVFINFWTTWCHYCVEEIPYLEKISKDYSKDVVVLGIAGPKSKENPKNPDVSKEKILEFIGNKKITYPILFDESGKYFAEYGIRFFPTSFVVGKDGYLDGYIPGGVSEENLKKIIEEAIKK